MGQIAVALSIVDAVADDEFIGDFEAHEVGHELDFAAAAFVEQYAGVKAGGVELLEHRDDDRKGFAGVEDVIDQQDVTVADIKGEILEDLGKALGTRVVAVAGDSNAIEADGIGDSAEEVGGEKNRAVDDRDDGDLLVAVGGSQFGTQFFDAFFDVFFGDKDGFEIGVEREIFGLGHAWTRFMSAGGAEGNWFVRVELNVTDQKGPILLT